MAGATARLVLVKLVVVVGLVVVPFVMIVVIVMGVVPVTVVVGMPLEIVSSGMVIYVVQARSQRMSLTMKNSMKMNLNQQLLG